MKKKFLYVAEVQLPGRKASSIHVMRMCKAFADQGVRVRLLAFRSAEFKSMSALFQYYGLEELVELKLIRSPGDGRLASCYLAFIAFWQVVFYRPHVAYTRSPVSAFSMSLIARRFVFEAHSFIHQSTHKWHFALFKWFVKRRSFLGLVVISDALKKMYVDRQMDADDIFTAHDGADQQPFENTGKLKGTYEFNAGYFGSVFNGRGIEVIIEMAREKEDVGFHIFGGEANELENPGELPGNLFFYGFVSPGSVHKYRNACDVLLAPYQPEVFVSKKQAYSTSMYMSPLKIFEYMSACKAIIVSNMPVLREVLSSRTALMVPSGDANAWAEGVETLRNDPDKRDQLAKSAYQHFLDHFTWHKRAAAIYSWLMQRLNY